MKIIGPIPGAVWHNHILQNADEIMPKTYLYTKDMDKELILIRTFLCRLYNHAPYLVSVEWNLSLSSGSEAIFVSNKMESLRCANRNQDQPLNDYYRHAIEGNVQAYSTPKKLNCFDTLQGAVSLLGEQPTQVDILNPLYGLRNSTLHHYQHIDLNYNGICCVMNTVRY